MIATYAVGGVVWDYGQYLLGLEALGFDVYYIEDTGWEAYNPVTGYYSSDYSYGARFLDAAMALLSPTLRDRWHLRAMDGTTFGLPEDEITSVLADAEVFINVSGAALLREPYMRCRKKVLIDTDPGWNHFVNYPRWDAGCGWEGVASWRQHDHFCTYAENLGSDDCVLPSLGVDWVPTRPLVALDRWQPEPPGTTWTTVMTWNNFGQRIEHDGRSYGTKEDEFGKIEHLPQLLNTALEVAVGGSEPPLDAWHRLGWSVVPASEVSSDASCYRSYVQGSRGELSVAKNVYVDTRSGWFSCRSVCYLAAGRPAVVQDTGFSRFIPTGQGLLCFSDEKAAQAAIEQVEADYAEHSRAARAIAEEHFRADRVLGVLLSQVGVD
jgi:hypothetical protein